MLANVKRRQPLLSANNLNNAIGMMMRGEVAEKRSVERFDVELSELESEDEEELEDIDISQLLPANRNKANQDQQAVTEKAEAEGEDEQQQLAELSERGDDIEEKRPHWGERVTDVNFKESQEQVRVRSDLLNNLVNYAGEVNIYHARMGKQISDFSFNLSELTSTVVRLKEQLRKLEIETEIQIRSGYEKESDTFDDNFDPLEMDQYSTLQQLTRSLSETASDVESINGILSEITRDSETLLLQESRISTDLQEGLMRTRMVRFGGLSSRLRRIVRQVARELGKEVELEIIGESSEVDRTVLDRIIAPLEHMLRNAVAHGIEKPEVRKAMGKNETGKIVIEVGRKGTSVVIDIKDDGSGINADKIRQKAIKQGLIKADSNLSDRAALQFILQSGFSTADEVTQVSGRGVGMDVVDSEIKQLGGVLDIDTVQGKGSNFRIRLPLTLAINQALLVSTADDIFAVPLSSIEGVVRITGLELQRFYDSENSHYEFNGFEYELKHLGGLLTGHQPNYSKQLQLFPVLLVHVGDKRFALHVDDLIGRREIVVKPVGMQIGAVRGIAGATILADGRVVLILEMSALVVAESLFKPHQPVVEEIAPAVVTDKKTIMVVDDSITIRKVTERMLKRYGIDVVLAKDGVDATNQLQDAIPDMMLLDIEMPRMDGFEVASYVRNDERLKNIPIIMITSRTGTKHKEKAMEIGVNQYLGKPFQEEELVSNINAILHTSF
jgi:chemosensory pili system protein ChpA (sensor histidine kinase/response regulator)